MTGTEKHEHRELMPDFSQIRNPDVAHERSDVDVRVIARFAIILVMAAVLIHILLWGLFHYFEARQVRSERPSSPLARERRQLPPEPRLQGAPGHEESPITEMEKFRLHEDQLLNGYGWVDQKGSVVRIPIEEAKKRLLQRGLPVREATPDRSEELKVESRRSKVEGRK